MFKVVQNLHSRRTRHVLLYLMVAERNSGLAPFASEQNIALKHSKLKSGSGEAFVMSQEAVFASKARPTKKVAMRERHDFVRAL